MTKKIRNIILCVFAALVLSCSPKIIYRDVIVTRDSLITRLDTQYVEKVKVEKVKDWTGLLDTLSLSTEQAEAQSWVDTSKAILCGELKDKDVPVKVVVKWKEKISYRDSIRTVEKEVPVEKTVKVVPLFWRVFGVIGIIAAVLAAVALFLKLKGRGLL